MFYWLEEVLPEFEKKDITPRHEHQEVGIATTFKSVPYTLVIFAHWCSVPWFSVASPTAL